MGFFETIRRWVDGEDSNDPLNQAAVEQGRPRRQAEDFIIKIAKEIGAVMNDEAVPLPPDQIVIPPEYIVFISEADDRNWQGVKRRALEQGLHHVLAEHARDLAGKTRLATTSFSVELRVDGTLPESEVRVQHSWEESSSSNKTSIVARPSAQPPKLDSKPTQNYVPPAPQFPSGETVNKFDSRQNQNDATSSQLAPTILGADVNNVISKQNDSNDGATRVSPRKASGNLDSEATKVGKRPFYRIEIWRDNKRESVEQIFKSEITIGRKSVKIPSDVQLDGDSEISRPHAIISRDEKGLFFVTHKGKNPTLVNGQEIPLEQPVQIRLDDTITICTFMLRVSA